MENVIWYWSRYINRKQFLSRLTCNIGNIGLSGRLSESLLNDLSMFLHMWMSMIRFVIVIITIIFIMFFFYWDKVSLHTLGCPWNHYVDQAGLWTHRFTCLCLTGAEIKDFKNTFDHKILFYGAHAQASSIIHVALMQSWLRTVTCVYPLLPRTLEPLHHEGCTASFTVSESNTSILLIYVHYCNMPHHPVTFIFMV